MKLLIPLLILSLNSYGALLARKDDLTGLTGASPEQIVAAVNSNLATNTTLARTSITNGLASTQWVLQQISGVTNGGGISSATASNIVSGMLVAAQPSSVNLTNWAMHAPSEYLPVVDFGTYSNSMKAWTNTVVTASTLAGYGYITPSSLTTTLSGYATVSSLNGIGNTITTLWNNTSGGSAVRDSGGGNAALISATATGALIQDNQISSSPLLTVNRKQVSSTGPIADFQIGGSSKASIDNIGRILTHGGIGWLGSINNSWVLPGVTGTEISRNLPSQTAPVLKISNLNNGSVDNLLEFYSKSSLKGYVGDDGSVAFTTYSVNGGTGGFLGELGLMDGYGGTSYISATPTGAEIGHMNNDNITDLTIRQDHASATGKFIEFKKAGVTKAYFDNAGNSFCQSYTHYGTSVTWKSGSGSPEGVVTAPVGSLFSRTDGGAGTTLYAKQSGTGNTGWVAK